MCHSNLAGQLLSLKCFFSDFFLPYLRPTAKYKIIAMGPKQKGGGGGGGTGGGSKQKGNNVTEEVEESLQAVVRVSFI